MDLYYQNILRPISKMSKLGWLNFPWNFFLCLNKRKKISTFHLTFCIFGALRFWYKCKFSWTKWLKHRFWSLPIPFSCNGQYPRGGFYFCMKLPFVVTLPKLLLDNQSLMLVVLPLGYLKRKILLGLVPFGHSKGWCVRWCLSRSHSGTVYFLRNWKASRLIGLCGAVLGRGGGCLLGTGGGFSGFLEVMLA